jgi:glycosyltransferase involved in cell wall biosynthesis
MQMATPRLLHIINSLNPGGAERLAVQMSQAFAGEFEVFVVCLDEPGSWANRLRRQDNIPVDCLYRQPGLDTGIILKLAQYCRRHQVDIIHAHQCTPWFYAALSRLIYGRPRLLFEEHGRLFPEVMNRKRVLFNSAVVRHLTDRFIAVSEDVRNRLVKYEGLNFEQVEIVYNGVAPGSPLDGTVREQLRQSLGIGPDDFLVGTAGRFDPIKNLPMLLKSIARAREKTASIRGLLVGNGPAFEQVEKLRDTLGLSELVVMPGHRDDARQLIQCMDLFVLSSFSEGTSMALLEAMASSVPVAVTAVGGNPEVVLSDRTGWVVASDCVRNLEGAILEAASHPQKARQFAESGRLRFHERFTREKMLQSYRGIYRELLNGVSGEQ